MMHQTRQTVLLRADGGPRLGLGHVLRCFALAEGLAEAGFEPVLALKPEAGSLEDLGLVTNFQVVAIPSVSTLAADALLTNKIAREYAVAYVIIDVCHLDNLNRRASLSEYLSDLRKQNLTVCFTGSDSLDFDADFVVSMTQIPETIQLACVMNGNSVLPIFDNLECGLTNSKFIKHYYKPSGAFYMGGWDLLLKNKNFFKGNVKGVVIPPERSIDINTLQDIKYAESIL